MGRMICICVVLLGCSASSAPPDGGAPAFDSGPPLDDAAVRDALPSADLAVPPDASSSCPDNDRDGARTMPCGNDCDDDDASRYPGNIERCDRRDDDCDPSTLGPDGDSDGSIATACCNPNAAGALVCGTDCDDARDAVRPGATEVCNERDDDCDGTTDEGVQSTFYFDFDGDDFGDMTMPRSACTAPAGYATRGTDCDDRVAGRNPGATEACDALDNDCDLMTDETFACVRGAPDVACSVCGQAGRGACGTACVVPVCLVSAYAQTATTPMGSGGCGARSCTVQYDAFPMTPAGRYEARFSVRAGGRDGTSSYTLGLDIDVLDGAGQVLASTTFSFGYCMTCSPQTNTSVIPLAFNHRYGASGCEPLRVRITNADAAHFSRTFELLSATVTRVGPPNPL